MNHCSLNLLFILYTVLAGVDGIAQEQRDFFEAKVRPVLVQECYSCHSAAAAHAGKLKGGLQLDTREGVLKGGDSGAVVVVGNPEESLLIQSLRHADDTPRMPPSGKLSDAVIHNLSEWIRMGLPDPRSGAVAAVKRGMTVEEGRKWWSLLPIRDVAAPKVSLADWPRGKVDRFILAKLEENSLTPVADADRTTLIRRVYFDLIGLPPAPEAIERFLSDTAADAYERVVEELLASSHFGERWGRHWLDAARYSDSNGRDRNILWYHAWRFRNYVIASFNEDKPYNQFVREQIAGDLMPADSLAQRDEQQIATGFLALGAKAFEELKPEIFRMDVVDEQLDVIGRSILGLSIGCARCHDHKFDPIPTRDYYAMAGILRSTQPLYGHGPRGIKATLHNHSKLIPIGPDAENLGLKGLTYFETLNDLNLKQNTARSDRYRVVRRVADAQNRLKQPGADVGRLQSEIDQMNVEIKDWDIKVKAAETEFQAAMDTPPLQPDWAMGARDQEHPDHCRIHLRGETTNLGDVVPRGVLQVLPNPVQEISTAESGRRQLADWLTSRENPLTARVYVNRIWLHLFGKGLVATPDDFGVNGAQPTHPELLDYLTVRFLSSNYSTKSLIRELILSRTYQLASASNTTAFRRDPENIWRWRMSSRRLEVEAIRDATMFVSGQLRLSPPQPEQEFLARRNPHRDAEFFNFAPPFQAHEIESPFRSVYLPVVRGVLPTIFSVFDFAAPDRSVAQRDVSTVPSQGLFLLNNSWIINQSRLTARRLLAETSLNDEGRIDLLFRLAFSRSPTTEEAESSLQYLLSAQSLREGADGKTLTNVDELREACWSTFCQAVIGSAEFRTLK